tara:strand:- start:1826 stop:1993 length:168 start_codon:yes stop_codon:yes gene_type:complete
VRHLLVKIAAGLLVGIPFGATIGIVIWLTSRNIEVAIWAAIGATLIWVADAVADR